MSSLEKRLSSYDKAGLRLLNQVAKELSAAYAKRAADDDATMSGIARALGCNRSVIYRRLAGDANMTLTTFGAIVKALEFRPADVLIVDNKRPKDSNRPPAMQVLSSGADVSAIPVNQITFLGRRATDAGALQGRITQSAEIEAI